MGGHWYGENLIKAAVECFVANPDLCRHCRRYSRSLFVIPTISKFLSLWSSPLLSPLLSQYCCSCFVSIIRFLPRPFFVLLFICRGRLA